MQTDRRYTTTSGTTDGMCSRRRMWKRSLCFGQGCWRAQCWKYGHQQLSGCGSFKPGSTAGAFLREDPSPAHLAWGLGGGGFAPTPFNQCSNAWRKQQASGTARPWHPRLCSTVGVSEPDCLGHLFIDFL